MYKTPECMLDHHTIAVCKVSDLYLSWYLLCVPYIMYCEAMRQFVVFYALMTLFTHIVSMETVTSGFMQYTIIGRYYCM